MKAGELIFEILMKGGGKALQDIRNLSAGIKDFRLGLMSALKSFDQISAAAREVAVQLDMYQLNTGLSAEQLQKLSFQASQAGVSMNELGSTIQKLQQKNANARLGYGWDPLLSRFGLHPGQNPVTQLNQIGSALRRLQATNPGEAHALAAKVGLSDTMYYALLRGTTEQMDKQLVLTQKEQSVLVKLNQQWNKFWFYLKQITVKLQVLSANMQTKFIKVLLNAAKGFLELFTRINKVIKANEKLRQVIAAVGVALAAYFTPWLLTLGLIAIVLDDIYAYFEGRDSVTGRIIEWCQKSEEFKKTWEGVTTLFEGIVQLIKWINDGIKELMEYSDKFGKLVDKHPALKQLIEIGQTALNPMKQIKNVSQGFADFKQAAYDFGEWTHPIVAGDANVNINNYFTSTGDTVKDGEIAGATGRAELDAVQGQSESRGLGNTYSSYAKLKTRMATD